MITVAGVAAEADEITDQRWSKQGFWWYWPVNNATHIDLQVAVISQQPLLHLDEVHRLVLHAEETHAALKDVEGIFTFLTVFVSGTAWTGK